MRHVLMATVLLTSAVTAQAADQKPAQPAAPEFKCDGEIWVIRKSEIIPGGTLDGFKKAVADHNAWYRKNAVTGNAQRVGRVIVMAKDQPPKLADTIVVTVHVNAPHDEDKLPRNDAAWKTFVAEYRANSKIIEETPVCMDPAK